MDDIDTRGERRLVMNHPARSPCLLFVVTEDWYFIAHRLGLARLARAAGFRVVVATRVDAGRAAIEDEGFELHALPFERAMTYPWRDLHTLRRIDALVRSVAPDLVHLVSLKPILLGGLALALRATPRPTVLGFTGLGYVFSSTAARARLLRPLIVRLLARIARRPATWVLAENEDDLRLLRTHGIVRDACARVIAGAGLDLSEYSPSELPAAAGALVLLPARVLRDKGVYEFVAAAESVRKTRPDVRFVIAGQHDTANPGAVAAAELNAWCARGVIEWWGHRNDMAAVYRQARIVCLPSYREGLSRALLEAAACGRPLVATDVPGCREICRDGATGILVPVHDAQALGSAVLALLDDDVRASNYGRAARVLVERDFALPVIAAQTIALYRELLAAA